MGSGHSKSRFSKQNQQQQQQHGQGQYSMPAPYPYPTAVPHQPVIPGYPNGMYGASYPAPPPFIPPPYGGQHGMHPAQMMNQWMPPPDRPRRSRRRTTRRERYSEDFVGNGYPSGRDERPMRSRSDAHSRSRRASEPAPPPVIPRSTGGHMHDPDSNRRAPTPFLAFPNTDADEDESEDEDYDYDDDDREPSAPQMSRRTTSRNSRRSSSRAPRRNTTRGGGGMSFPQPSIDPNPPLPRQIKNPLPDPPKDIYESTPYKHLLNLPQTTALLSATYGSSQPPYATAAPILMPVPATAPAPKQESKNPVKGLLRRLSTKKEKKKTTATGDQPQVRFYYPPPLNHQGPGMGMGVTAAGVVGAAPVIPNGNGAAPVSMPVPDVGQPPARPASRAHSTHSRRVSFNGDHGGGGAPVMRPQPSVGGPSDHGHGGEGVTMPQPVIPGQRGPTPGPGVTMPQGGGDGYPQHQYHPQSHMRSASMSMPQPPTGHIGANTSPHSAAESNTSSTYIPPVPPVPISPPEIRFDQDSPYWVFMNHSPHRIRYRDQTYPTALHLHEAIKFLDTMPDVAAAIRACEEVHEVYPLSAQYSQYQRPDWNSVFMEVMEDVIYHKFKQHPDLRLKLLETRTARLVYSDRDDPFWGTGEHGNGQNQLGKALMKVRERLRAEPGM